MMKPTKLLCLAVFALLSIGARGPAARADDVRRDANGRIVEVRSGQTVRDGNGVFLRTCEVRRNADGSRTITERDARTGAILSTRSESASGRK